MRKLMSVLLAAVLVGLTACSGDTGSPSPAESSPPESSSQVVEAEPTPEPTEEPTPTLEPSPTPAPVKRIAKKMVYGPYEELYYWHEYTYDADGRKSSVTSYNSYGTETGHVDLTYTEDGTQLQTYYTQGVAAVRYVNGNLELPTLESDTGKVYQVDNEVESVQESLFNEKNQVIRTNFYKESGNDEIISYHEYDYDEDGNRIRKKTCLPNGSIVQYTIYGYDSNGNCICEKMYNGSGNEEEDFLTGYVIYEYNEKGEEITKTQYNGEGHPFGEGILYSSTVTDYYDDGHCFNIYVTYNHECEYYKNNNNTHTVHYYEDDEYRIEKYLVIEDQEILVSCEKNIYE